MTYSITRGLWQTECETDSVHLDTTSLTTTDISSKLCEEQIEKNKLL